MRLRPQEPHDGGSTFHTRPAGPWPAGQAWYPLLGTYGPAGSNIADEAFGFDFGGEDEIESDPTFWTTANGDVIPIEKLETTHLRNILRMIERKNGGPGCLVKIQKKNERVANLAEEFLRRF